MECPCVFAVLNSAMNIGVKISFGVRSFVLPIHIYPGVELLVLMVAVLSVKTGASVLFPILVAPIYTPTNSMVFFSTSSPAFTICGLFDDGLSDQYEVIPHCGLDLHFSIN